MKKEVELRQAIIDLIARGLERLAEECRQKDNFFLPNKIFLALLKLVRWPAVELLMVQNVKILLVRRSGNEIYYPNYWTLPGGFVRWRESLREACERVARREVGIKVCSVKEFGYREWTDHPYGNPISFFFFCFLRRKIRETEDVRFFGINELPENLPKLQREFIENYLSAKSDHAT